MVGCQKWQDDHQASAGSVLVIDLAAKIGILPVLLAALRRYDIALDIGVIDQESRLSRETPQASPLMLIQEREMLHERSGFLYPHQHEGAAGLANDEFVYPDQFLLDGWSKPCRMTENSQGSVQDDRESS